MNLLIKSTAIASIVLCQFSGCLLASPTEVEQSEDRNQVPIGMICAPAPGPTYVTEVFDLSTPQALPIVLAEGFEVPEYSRFMYTDDTIAKVIVPKTNSNRLINKISFQGVVAYGSQNVIIDHDGHEQQFSFNDTTREHTFTFFVNSSDTKDTEIVFQLPNAVFRSRADPKYNGLTFKYLEVEFIVQSHVAPETAAAAAATASCIIFGR